jgi:hypothetical protein
MKPLTLALALSGILLLPLNSWGEKLTPGEQAHASVAAHRKESKNHSQRSHYKSYKKGHHRHHRHHDAA